VFSPCASSRRQKGSTQVPAPVLSYWKAGLTNSIGPACGLHALKYISYPAQVLAKSSKMIPVMVMGTLLHGKQYSVLDYTCCSLVAGQCVLAYCVG
jgi:solute carrier family 35 (UDP-galactose transporter), member B1